MSERQHPSPRRRWLHALRQNESEEVASGFLRWWAILLILLVLGFLAFTFFVSAAGPLSPFFVPMLLASAAIVLLLLVLVMFAVARLLLRLRRGEVGSQLATRLVVIITILSLTPAAVVFAFSWRYLNQGIDSWLSSAVEIALEQAVDVAKAGVDRYRSSTLLSAETIAQSLTGAPNSAAVLTVIQMRDQFRLSSVTLFSSSNRIIATSSDNLELVPRLPRDLLLNVHANHPVVKMASDDGQMLVRVLIPVMNPQFGHGNRLLYVEQVVPEQFSRAAAAVQNADHRYRQLTLMRGPMKTAFQMTLAVALLLTALSALWIALLLARRLTAPVARLAAGTQAVARGEFIPLQIIPSNDELGVLVHSFNNMTRQLARAKQQAARAQEEAEQRRYYLETILAQISSGILIYANDGTISEINAAARQILRLAGEEELPEPEKEPQLEEFWAQAQDWIQQPRNDMQRELQIERSEGAQTLLLHGARFAELGGAEGFVLVFDDISPLVAAQRSAAWGEVARRLAHEIKNPLTPIQLSAERLRRKYLDKLGGEGETLDRATHTIIQQVDALKVLVDAFSEYARAPKLELRPIDLNALIADVVELYRGQGAGVEIRCNLAPDLPLLRADAHRLRQILNNLLRNAIDAIAADSENSTSNKHIWIHTRATLEQSPPMLEWTVEDDGPGFPAELLARVFEPYVTSKPKGSGLGLAIVRRIVEEHGGQIEAGSRGATTGARVCMHFPLPVRVAEDG